MTIPETRWSEFRRRNPPAKQARTIIFLFFGCAVYIYALLFFQPQQAHEIVMKENQRVAQTLHQIRVQRAQVQERSLREGSNEFTASSSSRDANSTLVSSHNSHNRNDGIFLDTFLSFLSTLMIVSIIRRRARRMRTDRPTAAMQHARARAFSQWVQRLNRHRQHHGERPISLEALRLVLRERELTGNDYDALLDYEDQSGPAMQALLEGVGMTSEEVARYPMRVLQPNDDLLREQNGKIPSCAVCLEDYVSGETVRTIPCFHTFHSKCIDTWLSGKALCPICKHPALS